MADEDTDWFKKKSEHVVEIGDGKPPFTLDLGDGPEALRQELEQQRKKKQ